MPDVKEAFLREVLEMEKIFSNLNLCIRGASVFIAVDRVTCKANIKLIDFGLVRSSLGKAIVPILNGPLPSATKDAE